ncbi:MAG: FTR1 family iron permease [Candidatus Dormibacteria bacterium]
MSAGPDTVASLLNPALVVVREGIEGVLIVASLGASLRGSTTAGLRRALWGGVVLALLATIATWLGAAALLGSLGGVSRYLEAGVSIASVLILLLITNWFFHRVYWTGWVAKFHQQKKRRLAGDSGQLVGMVTLGFTSTYREGFEAVLFLQALGLQTSTSSVVSGAAVGTLVVVAAGAAVLGMQLRLPYKKMLVATGLMISAVLVVMVGNTVHAMQEVGWMTTTPSVVPVPSWAGPWFGSYGSIEAIGSQVLAAAVVFGSYWLAERRHRPAPQHRWRIVRLTGILVSSLLETG